MNKTTSILEQFNNSFLAFSEEEVKDSFIKKLREFEVEDVTVSDIQIEHDGDVLIEFSDSEGDSILAAFTVEKDEEGDTVPLITVFDDDIDNEDSEHFEINLQPLSPSLIMKPYGGFINLQDLSWMNKSVLFAILQAGDVGVTEEHRKVVRGGKVVKIPIIKNKKKKKMSPAQKRALEKARKKSNTGAAKKARKKSLKVRKKKNI